MTDPGQADSTIGTKNSRGQSLKRAIVFHLLSFILVMCPVIGIELLVRLCVPITPSIQADPYVSFAGTRKLFASNADGTHWEIASERLNYFYPQSFTAQKKAESLRIFCLGGSTVQGRPYGVETAFSTWLQLCLQAALPQQRVEVVNCGGVSYASYRLVPILKEVLDHQPDLIVLYTGHNEFLEDRTYHTLKRMPKALIQLHRSLLFLRSYALADRWMARHRAGRRSKTILPTEVSATLDLPQGLATYQRNPTWRTGTARHFRHNLRTMIRLTQAAKVPLLLVLPVSNLKDCPPFKSQHTSGLNKDDLLRVKDLRKQTQSTDWSQVQQKRKHLEQAAMLDPHHAELLYLVGTCYHYLGRPDLAKPWFIRARDEDICPLRMTTALERILVEESVAYDVPLIGFRDWIEKHSADHIPGQEWLIDHVHISIEGHQQLADQIYHTMIKLGFVTSPPHWQTHRDSLWRAHFDSLEELYFAQGLARLESLHMWSRGTRPDSGVKNTAPPNSK